MKKDRPPQRKSVGCTVAGWYWYCDVHDTHGNADSKAEAEFVSDAHRVYFQSFPVEYEECDLSIIEVSPVGLAVTDG